MLHHLPPRLRSGVVSFLGLGRALLALTAAAVPALQGAPVTTHPRLLLRAADLPALRDRMNANNDVWVAFKTQVVDKALRDWKCSATSAYVLNDGGTPNDPSDDWHQWVRTSFTDEQGILHTPADADWNAKWSNQAERPAAPEDDVGEPSGNVRLFSEQYAMIFSFMARLLKDQPGDEVQKQRAEYLAAAKECLFKVIDPASLGNDATQPFRAPNFAVNDRSFSNEAFSFSVDWIYEDLTPAELAKIRKTFLLWSEQCNAHVYFAPHRVNGQHGTPNSPSLLRLDDPVDGPRRNEVRLALNNHWANHLREMGLFGLALDPKDDVPSAFPGIDDTAPAGSVTSQIVGAGGVNDWVPVDYGVLRDTTGVWLYLTDYAYRHDGAGGLSVEGSQYASNGLGPIALFMAALQSAGQDNPAVWGPQVSLQNHPFWSRQIPAYLAMLPPTSRITSDPNSSYLGAIYQPPIFGDLETFSYVNDQFIKVLAPMALADARANGPASPVASAVRYIQRNLAEGGPSRLDTRIGSTWPSKHPRDAIYYFLALDPAAPAAADPRPTLQSSTFYAQHAVNGREMGTVIGRTGPGANDTMFHFRADWNRIDHQRGDSLSFGLWKNGLWLTKVMAGYGVIQGCSDYRNSLSLQNGTPTVNQSPVGESTSAAHGSQWDYSPSGDPAIVARSVADDFIYFSADATALYNHAHYENLREIEHASRSIVWLKPNRVVVYDRARSKAAGYFKRFYLNLPDTQAASAVVGATVHSSAREGAVAKAELFVTALLPAGAVPQLTDISSGQPSGGEDMKSRMFTEAPGAPQETRFLHVVEGTAAGVANATPAQVVASVDGAFEGAVTGDTLVLFRTDLTSIAQSFSFAAPAGVTRFYLTGLAPSSGYAVSGAAGGTITVQPGSQLYTDAGGVLTLGGNALPSVAIKAGAASVFEASGSPVPFTVSRSGAVSQPLVVALGLDATTSSATAADVSGLPAQVTIPAGSASATFDITPIADGLAELTETLVVQLSPGAAYQIDAATAQASLAITESAPLSGHAQFSAAAFTAAENAPSGSAALTVTRTGGIDGALSVNYVVTGGTATAGTDYTPASGTLTWADGDNAPKTISLPLLDDTAPESSETVILALISPSVPTGLGSPASATLTLTDDETSSPGGGNNNSGGGDPTPATPGVGTLQFVATSTTVAETAGVATLTVSRTAGSTGVVSVGYYTLSYSATHGDDYTYSSGTLTWADGDTAPKTITIPILDDTAPEPVEYFKVALQSPGNGAVLGANTDATVNLNDDDSAPAGGGDNGSDHGGGTSGGAAIPGTLEFAATALDVEENAGAITLTVTRSGGADGAVSVNYYTLAGSAHSGSDYGYTSGTLHWAAGDAAPRTIVVPILNDWVEEPAESFQLTLDAPAGGATLGASAIATITIADDEVVYDVGPGQPLASLAQVPWTTLAPGTIVRLHWRAAPYAEKILLSTRGTAGAPILLEGVPGPNGEQPIIDGTGAIAAANTAYAPWYGDVMERSIIAIARNNSQPSSYQPGYITIANLELTMSGAKMPMPSYTKPDGTTATYYTSTGAIFIYGGEHVTVRDCTIHDTPNGIVAASGSTGPTITRDLTIDRCYLYNAGKGGQYHGNNVMTEGLGMTVQFSRLGRGLNPNDNSNLVDRSAGTLVRYNWIEGGAKLIDLIEPGSSSAASITTDPSFAVAQVYGNILVNGKGDSSTDGSNLVRYGGDWGNVAAFRSGTLHFHHNTAVVDSTRWSTTVFNVSLAAATVVANNNVIHHAKFSPGGGAFNLISSGRTIALGRNWIRAGYTLNGIAANGTGLVLSGTAPGFINQAVQNFRPAAGSPLVDAATALPAGALPVDFEYLPEAEGAPRAVVGAAADLGAFEASAP